MNNAEEISRESTRINTNWETVDSLLFAKFVASFVVAENLWKTRPKLREICVDAPL